MDEGDVIKSKLLALKGQLDKLGPPAGENEIQEVYTSDDERVDRIRLRGPSVVALANACNRCRATSALKSSSSALLRCGTCKVALYCCKKCQKEDWIYHKKWCKSWVKSGVDPTKALRVPLRREDVVKGDGIGASDVRRTDVPEDTIAGLSGVEEYDESEGVSVTTTDASCIDECCAATGEHAPIKAKHGNTKRVQFADGTKPGPEDTKEAEEDGIEMGSFTVVPQGEENMAWMRAFMHYPFEVDDEAGEDDDDGSDVYQDLDEKDPEDSEDFRKDPVTGRTLSEFGMMMRGSRIPAPTHDAPVVATPVHSAPPTATVGRVMERMPPPGVVSCEDTPAAGSRKPHPTTVPAAVGPVVERMSKLAVVSHEGNPAPSAEVSSKAPVMSRFAAARLQKQ